MFMFQRSQRVLRSRYIMFWDVRFSHLNKDYLLTHQRLVHCSSVLQCTTVRLCSKRAVVLEYGQRQTDTHTDTQTDGRHHNTFRWAMPNANDVNMG